MGAILGPLAALMGIEMDQLKARMMRQVLLWAAVGALGIVAASFVLVAINSALTLMVGPVVAPLIIAGSALFIALVVFLVVHFLDARQARRDAERQKSADMTALVTTVAITAIPLLLPTLKKVGLPAGAAAAAIFALLHSRQARHDD